MSLFVKDILDSDSDSITIQYFTNNRVFKLIKEKALILSNNKIGPKIITINKDEKTIKYENVDVLDDGNYPMDKSEMKQKINELVNKLHELGYAHGNLEISNIGHKNGKFYIINPDTLFKINEPDIIIRYWLLTTTNKSMETINDVITEDYISWKKDLDLEE